MIPSAARADPPPDADWRDLVPRLRKSAARLVPHQDVDDLVQDTLCELLRTEGRWRAEGSAARSSLAVALTICRRRAANVYRRRGRLRLVPCEDWELQPAPAVESPIPAAISPPVEESWHGFGRRQRRIVAIVMAGGTADDCAVALALPRKEVHRVMRQIGARCTEARAARMRAQFHTAGDYVGASRPQPSIPGAAVG